MSRPSPSKQPLESAAYAILLVQLRIPAPVVQSALPGAGRVIAARHLLQACQALEAVRPRMVFVSEKFPAMELSVLREKVDEGTELHRVPAEADVYTLIGLVTGDPMSWQPPRL